MNKFRYVDSPDHVDGFQCLSCKGFYIGNLYSPYNYCPNCGIKFEGQHQCRQAYVKRWEFDRYGEDGAPYEVKAKSYQQPEDNRRWIIEERTCWPKDGWTEWKFETDLKGKYCNHKSAKATLDRLRYGNSGDCYIKWEYRIRNATT